MKQEVTAGSLDLNQIIHFHMKNKGILKFFAGLAIGIGIGFATNSAGIGIGIGIAFGAAFSQGKIGGRNDKNNKVKNK
jgi:hypothetical protein|tara:strand:- start:930 stop:1163 length:234 start_codon:yes stop_codon:yes gene_type:complete